MESSRRKFGSEQGSPQGPLSPVLFILFIGSLYRALESAPHTIAVGFADDTNVVGIGKTKNQALARLGAAWAICAEWSRTAGLRFNPTKTELIRFTKERTPDQIEIQIGTETVQAKEAVRFLGVTLDRRLNWKAHIAAATEKFKSQVRALSGTGASTWGSPAIQARHIYTAVVRSAMMYGSTVIHDPLYVRKTTGYEESLAKLQQQALQRILGAFKRTPRAILESEAAIPPVDIYLGELLGKARAREERSTMEDMIRAAHETITGALRRRGRRGRPPRDAQREPDAERQAWIQAEPEPIAGAIKWEERWKEQAGNRRGSGPAATQELPGHDKAAFNRRHRDLRRHESSALTQMRTGLIGLRAADRRTEAIATGDMVEIDTGRLGAILQLMDGIGAEQDRPRLAPAWDPARNNVRAGRRRWRQICEPREQEDVGYRLVPVPGTNRNRVIFGL